MIHLKLWALRGVPIVAVALLSNDATIAQTLQASFETEVWLFAHLPEVLG